MLWVTVVLPNDNFLKVLLKDHSLELFQFEYYTYFKILTSNAYLHLTIPDAESLSLSASSLCAFLQG